MTTPDKDALARKKRKGRVAAIATFYGLVLLFILSALVQLTRQALVSKASPSKELDCRQGVRSLALAVESARQLTEGTESTPEEALTRFRSALGPQWEQRDQIAQACRQQGKAKLLEAFDTVERLRYAEENAVRRDARDLSPLRRATKTLLSGPLAEAER